MRCRGVLAAAGTSLLLVALSSCSAAPPEACSAVAYSNSVRVQVSGHTSRVADVGFCGGATCTPHRLAMVYEGSGSKPTPIFPVSHEGDTWSVPTAFERPRIGHVAAFDSGGSIVADSRVRLAWRNMGTEACPGPYEASTSLVVGG